MWTVGTWTPLGVIQQPSVLRVSVSRNGASLLTIGHGANLWDTRSGKHIACVDNTLEYAQGMMSQDATRAVLAGNQRHSQKYIIQWCDLGV